MISSANCTDCADTGGSPSYRVIRGGDFSDAVSDLSASYYEGEAPEGRTYYLGFRCARTP